EENFEEEPKAESDVEDPAPYPVRAALSITKSNSPVALNIDLMCQEGHFVIGNISPWDNTRYKSLFYWCAITDLTAEADWKQWGLYIGPQVIDTLDVAVQDESEMFLQERGINASVASFIPKYAVHKEQ
ncbi:hypothetical protein BYT27DRAFT_7088034, partial [Phlegmacium glaucopus]